MAAGAAAGMAGLALLALLVAAPVQVAGSPLPHVHGQGGGLPVDMRLMAVEQIAKAQQQMASGRNVARIPAIEGMTARAWGSPVTCVEMTGPSGSTIHATAQAMSAGRCPERTKQAWTSRSGTYA